MSPSEDYDVVIVGGGPAGCAAGVFCARAELTTVIYDCGRASLKRCAHLENYPGFPAGIDIETLYDLFHDQAERAGCDIVPDTVESLARPASGEGFLVQTQDNEPVTTKRVIAATRYDGEYMRGLGQDEAMFETYTHDGTKKEHFDRSYPNRDGTTPIHGLYIASPSEESQQAITATGRGARVAREVITDTRMDRGWWKAVAEDIDWVRRAVELDAERTDRDRWVERFDERYKEHAPADEDRYERVRRQAIEDSRASYIDQAESDRRAQAAHESLASHLDTEAVVAGCDERALLTAMDDAEIAAYLDDTGERERPTSE